MGKPKTLLEGLCGHALSFGADSITVEHKEDGADWVFAQIDGVKTRIYRSTKDAEELRQDLRAAAKRPVRTITGGGVFVLTVRASENSGEGAIDVLIDPASPLNPSTKPSFTAMQGQYLAFIYNYTKIHRQAPSEADLQNYFRVTPPSAHDMVKTLQLNGLIEKTPGKARSIRLLVQPEHLPRLG